MPTVLRVEGFDVMIYTADHLPEHVHIFKGGNEIIINIADISVRGNYGLSGREARQAQQLVADNQQFLLAEWQRIGPVA